MAITFQPDKLLSKVASPRMISRLLTSRLTLNRAALSMVLRSDLVSKKALTETVLGVISDYRKSYDDKLDEGLSATEAKEEAVNNKRLLISRVRNTVVKSIAKKVKRKYRGEFYTWLPSSAETPDPEHQLNYGETFQLGVGEQPGDRDGCMCGMDIHVDETELEL